MGMPRLPRHRRGNRGICVHYVCMRACLGVPRSMFLFRFVFVSCAKTHILYHTTRCILHTCNFATQATTTCFEHVFGGVLLGRPCMCTRTYIYIYIHSLTRVACTRCCHICKHIHILSAQLASHANCIAHVCTLISTRRI